MNVGIASHITAAAPGPGARRYDPSLSPEERSGFDNGIWLCRGCDGIVDRDEVRFPVDTLHRLKRDHTEFVRLGGHSEAEVGLIAVGPDIVMGGQVVGIDGFRTTLRLSFFLKGSFDDLFAFVRRFDSRAPQSRYALLTEPGFGGLLSVAPELIRDGQTWTMTIQWMPEAPRIAISDLAGMSRHDGKALSGEPYWNQTIKAVLERSPGTWFADMDGGSHLSDLHETLRGSTWFEHLVKCELIRLAFVPTFGRHGADANRHPQLPCVRQVLGVRVRNDMPEEGHMLLTVDLDLEGHGRWTADLTVAILDPLSLRKNRAKAAWMAENIRRIEQGGRMLPDPVPPDGWEVGDGYPT
jgi:hypothetical protein